MENDLQKSIFPKTYLSLSLLWTANLSLHSFTPPGWVTENITHLVPVFPTVLKGRALAISGENNPAKWNALLSHCI